MNLENLPHVELPHFSFVSDSASVVITHLYDFLEDEKVLERLIEEAIVHIVVSYLEKKRIRAPDRCTDYRLTSLEKIVIRFLVRFIIRLLIELTKNIFKSVFA